MSVNKIFYKKITLTLSIVGISIGLVIFTGLIKGNPALVESLSNWNAKPVVVNIQVDLEKEGD